jgi:hypothetical protein
MLILFSVHDFVRNTDKNQVVKNREGIIIYSLLFDSTIIFKKLGIQFHKKYQSYSWKIKEAF